MAHFLFQKTEAGEEKLTGEELTKFSAWVKDTALVGKVSEVKASDRLVDTPVLVADYEGSQMRRMMKFVDPSGAKSMQLPMQKLQINPKHPLIVNLSKTYKSNPEIAQVNELFFARVCVKPPRFLVGSGTTAGQCLGFRWSH